MNNESMLKIAICDDEQPIRDYLKKLTEKCTDAQVHVFANGEELLSDPTVYDIILLDISLNRKPGQWQTKRHGSRKENQGNLRCDHYFCDCLKGICV